jgi:hypothetical protein
LWQALQLFMLPVTAIILPGAARTISISMNTIEAARLTKRLCNFITNSLSEHLSLNGITPQLAAG